MSNYTALLDCAAIQSAFRAGAEVEESLDAQLDESLAALEAYQSHLDGWQSQLARERNELRQAREQWELDREAAGDKPTNLSEEESSELNKLREKCATLEAQQTSLSSELADTRTREQRLKAEFESQQQSFDQERAQWAEVSKQLREGLDQRSVAASASQGAPPASEPRPVVPNRESSGSSAVLGSIVEQFGKLRQQRAIDRQGSKKAR